MNVIGSLGGRPRPPRSSGGSTERWSCFDQKAVWAESPLRQHREGPALPLLSMRQTPSRPEGSGFAINRQRARRRQIGPRMSACRKRPSRLPLFAAGWRTTQIKIPPKPKGASTKPKPGRSPSFPANPYLALGPAARIASEASNCLKLASKRVARSTAVRS
jgi:hypothetical protein